VDTKALLDTAMSSFYQSGARDMINSMMEYIEQDEEGI
jgi:hypothetical protein